MKIYYYMTVNYFKQNGMIPDEDIMAVLSYFFGGAILQDRESSGDSSSISSKDKELELISQTPFDIKFNHDVNIKGGILEEECSLLIKDFFKELRQNKN